MTRLLSVEWLRLRSRRVFWILGVVVIAGIALSMFSLARDARPPSAEDRAVAEQLAARDAQQPGLQDAVDACIQAQESGNDTLDYPPDFDCNELLPNVDNYLNTRTVDLVGELRDGALGVASMGSLAALLIGVSFMSADWTSGVVGTQLLYEPRRRRVFAAKAAIAGIGGAAIAVVVVVLHALGVWAIASAWGTTAGFGDAAGSLALQALRMIALVAFAGVTGLALVAALRHSTSVLGLVVVYLFFGEGLLRSFWHGIEPWLLSDRIAAWVQGSYRIENYDACNQGNFQDVCIPQVTILHAGPSAAYLLVVGALVAAVTLAVFERRDVS